MKIGSLVTYRFYNYFDKNKANLGIIVDIQTDVLYPTDWGYEVVDIAKIEWIAGDTYHKLPYHSIGNNGVRWYLTSTLKVVEREREE